MTLHVHSRVVDESRPLLDLLPDVPDPLAWVRDGDGLVGWGVAARMQVGQGRDRFDRAQSWLAAVAADSEVHDEVGQRGSGLIGIGSFSFDADADGSVLIVPRVLFGRRDGRTWRTDIRPAGAPEAVGPATSVSRPGPRDRPRYAGSSLPDVHWLDAVARAIERIGDGEADKVVLARDHAVWSREPFDVRDLARRLTRRFPRCHTFLVEGLVGATPELLLARRGAAVTSRVLAGTTGRSDDEVADAALGAALLESAKDLAEHRYAADSVREVLGPRCRDLAGEPGPRLLRLDNVQHLATSFTGHLDDPDVSALELVGELHPTAAVGGSPRDAALAMIRELEGMSRGRYAAPVGWSDAAGDGEWGIALRCAELAGARARLFAGVGVVDASLPEAELEETRLKLLAMQAALETGPEVEPGPGPGSG